MSCDVTRHNFHSLLPRVRQAIARCHFAAFDAEYTALKVDQRYTGSLFDTLEDRYQKMRGNARQSVISQFGLSLFHLNSDSSEYTVETFNFFVCPRSFGPIDQPFVCQPSSLQFLAKHGFDFNKFIHEGISYLNASQRKELRREMGQSGAFFGALERNMDLDEEDALRKISAKVSDWSLKAAAAAGREDGVVASAEGDGGLSDVDCVGLIISAGVVDPFIVHQEIRKKHPNLWTFKVEDDPKSIRVRRIGEEERRELAKDDLEEEFVQDLTGFAHVVEALSKARTPIVGHNCYGDLVRLYQQFVDELPETFEDFKSAIHAKFPCVIDTKHFCYRLRRQLEDEDLKLASALLSTKLADLMIALSVGFTQSGTEDKAKMDPLFCPRITESSDEIFTKKYGDHADFHEAGYDAYSTGYCCVKMTYLAAGVNDVPAAGTRYLNLREQKIAVSKYVNELNLSRAPVMFLNLNGKDPTNSRVETLVATVKRTGGHLDHVDLAEKLARFGSVDTKVNPAHESQVLVAVSRKKTCDDILKAFQLNQDIRIERYQRGKHGKGAMVAKRISGWLGLATAAYLAYKIICSNCDCSKAQNM